MRGGVGSVLVLWPSLLVSPSASFRRSALLPLWSKLEVGDDRWGHLVSDCVVQNEFSVFQIWMNSDVICYFCVDLFRVPKIMKFFVWRLYDVYYLRKIWNVVFKYFLNVIKIAQLINKWVFMIFLGLFLYPKIMKLVLPLSYYDMNIYKKFGLNWNKLIYFIILN